MCGWYSSHKHWVLPLGWLPDAGQLEENGLLGRGPLKRQEQKWLLSDRGKLKGCIIYEYDFFFFFLNCESYKAIVVESQNTNIELIGPFKCMHVYTL